MKTMEIFTWSSSAKIASMDSTCFKRPGQNLTPATVLDPHWSSKEVSLEYDGKGFSIINTGAVSSGFVPGDEGVVTRGLAPTNVGVGRSDENPLATMNSRCRKRPNCRRLNAGGRTVE